MNHEGFGARMSTSARHYSEGQQVGAAKSSGSIRKMITRALNEALRSRAGQHSRKDLRASSQLAGASLWSMFVHS